MIIHNHRRLFSPWSWHDGLYCSPRRVILKLALGEDPADIPAAIDVRVGAAIPASRVDGGPVDRILKRFAGNVQVVRVHTSAVSNGLAGSRHLGFDDLEHSIGLSRTLCVEAPKACCVDDFVSALSQLDIVEDASPYYLTTSLLANRDDLSAPPQTITADPGMAWESRDQIGAAQAMAYEPGDPTVIVAVVDTGIAKFHPELVETGRVRAGLDTVQIGNRDLASGVRLLGDRAEVDMEPDDEVGHGTACAAAISASGRNIPPGLAGDCSLLPIRVLAAARITGRSAPIGIGAIADIDFGVKTAIDWGASVVNMSFGTPDSSFETNRPVPHQDVVQYGLARGCVMVAASGNSGRAEDYSPATLDGVVAVGSVGATGQPSSFSTSGDHVALSAPGERVVSAGIRGYQFVTGTSFAAPFVSATAALLISRSRRRQRPVGHETIRRILVQSAQPWTTGPVTGHGAGILNAYTALRQLDEVMDQAQPSNSSRFVG